MPKNKKTLNTKPSIGFIGQGWIGKNYANDFEKRGFEVTRYALEPQYAHNKDRIRDCDIVFIAVPTPTVAGKFDDSYIRGVLPLIGKGKTAVIKSTLLPGTTSTLQKKFKNIVILHSPEFLTEANAEYDAANPQRNIVGIPIKSKAYTDKAREVISLLPKAPYELICSSTEAELIKYGGNCFLYTKVVFMNILFDYATGIDCDFNVISEAMMNDKRIGKSHMRPHHSNGRGAGGNCFIKDFEAFMRGYEKSASKDKHGKNALKALRDKNYDLLRKSKKDLHLLKKVIHG